MVWEGGARPRRHLWFALLTVPYPLSALAPPFARRRRTFLRQRVESKLASVWFLQGKFADALELISALLTELKKLDDKQLLVETHLTEAKVRMIGGWGNQTPTLRSLAH